MLKSLTLLQIAFWMLISINIELYRIYNNNSNNDVRV